MSLNDTNRMKIENSANLTDSSALFFTWKNKENWRLIGAMCKTKSRTYPQVVVVINRHWQRFTVSEVFRLTEFNWPKIGDY